STSPNVMLPFQIERAIASFPARLRGRRLATEKRQHFSGDVTRVALGREEHERRRDLLRLRRPFHRRLLSELRNRFGRFVGWIERGPDGTRRNAVDAYAFAYEILRERFGKRVDCALRRGIIEKFGAALQTRNGPGVDDRTSGF